MQTRTFTHQKVQKLIIQIIPMNRAVCMCNNQCLYVNKSLQLIGSSQKANIQILFRFSMDGIKL